MFLPIEYLPPFITCFYRKKKTLKEVFREEIDARAAAKDLRNRRRSNLLKQHSLGVVEELQASNSISNYGSVSLSPYMVSST